MNCQSPLKLFFIVVAATGLTGCNPSPPRAGERVDENSATTTPAAPSTFTPRVPNEKAQPPAGNIAKPSPEPDETREPRELAQRLRAEPEPEERGALVGELWDLATPEVVEILRQQFFLEQDTDVKADIVAGLVAEQKPETRELRFGILSAALSPAQPAEVRETAIAILVEFDDVRAVALLQNLLQDASPDIREAAQEALEIRRERDAK